MNDKIKAEIKECENYLAIQGDNELDHPFYEGRIEALKWVLSLIQEGESK